MRILPGDRILLMFYGLFDAAEFFLLFLVFAPLLAGELFLFPKSARALFHIGPVIDIGHGVPALMAFPDLLQMDDPVCRVF